VKKSINILGLCIDLRVVGVLILVAGGTLVVAPQLFWTALPVLAVLACPISMFVMMRGMNGRGTMPGAEARAANLALTPTGASEAPARPQQLRDLQEQLDRVQSQQASIADQMRALRTDDQPLNSSGGGGLGPN